MGGRVPDAWDADDDQSQAERVLERWGISEPTDDPDADTIRDDLSMSDESEGRSSTAEGQGSSEDDPEPVPTHECGVCRDYKTHIESAPGKDYNWCPECEGVQRFVRLDRADS